MTSRDRHATTDVPHAAETAELPTDDASADATAGSGDVSPARRLLRHPISIGFLVVVGAAALWWMGYIAGETLYLATDGDGVSIAMMAGIVILVPVLLIGGGVWLDRRRRNRSDDTRGQR